MTAVNAAQNAPARRAKLGQLIATLVVSAGALGAVAIGIKAFHLKNHDAARARAAKVVRPAPARQPADEAVGLVLMVAYTALPVRSTTVADTAALGRLFRRDRFFLDALARGAPVPRRYLAAVPPDIKDAVKTIALRKALFFKLALPVILRVNERIAAERRYLLFLLSKIRRGGFLRPVERAWLAGLAKAYRLDRVDFEALARRVDVIPASLALAQAIVESGWGTSVAARRGNALFGQMSYDGSGIAGTRIMQGNTPAKIAGFPSLYHSAAAYARNLNTHPAYRQFRRARADLRRDGFAEVGPALARTLLKYSELRERYVRYLLTAMRIERLGRFDSARLEPIIALGGS